MAGKSASGGGSDPDMSLSASAPEPHELAIDSVFQQGAPADPPVLQVLQFGGGV
jgi:hypothetical protein